MKNKESPLIVRIADCVMSGVCVVYTLPNLTDDENPILTDDDKD